ncbi:ribosome small subunit-dependent GTPase A [Aneurinibacillus thermoaerophilus]|uniref:Small ribosomal subunit biogenesis GTPase RsgA n=1 Tax=Aneurinibacillus thermoaerophilus TaxID=143495 RepID=A0A1G7WB33_ANETH|nr:MULTISPECIES: ribosome small subunit-dependent GTPase A [Aneurinibacillus]AMA72614.1 GTPase RsgA [Aneurinibacillus sp. XH2]MED0756735.1 ribosome small subunit-dependent GTPase A [Aneurinibacillus thermoaerophilus]MED0760785.1 ribosome small subunit-dependent GTPase A [Aneurinibacillus thermoaerophilus]SDG69168.1 ribosome biogenesis GTPase [Aneurinibacillus thermoaerophilus]
MPQGRIVKVLAGYYYVQDGDQCWRCRARGVFRKKGITPLVGDEVVYEANGTEGTVTEVLPRTSELIRPPIANIDQAILVFSLVEPDFNPQLLDKFLVHTEAAGVDAVICLTKADLVPNISEIERVWAYCEAIGYPVAVTSSKSKSGIEEIRARLRGHLSVFAGQSGVGKSSLLNALFNELNLETAPISQKLGRGRHTTRHVELIRLPEGGWVADTPGFSSLDFQAIAAGELGLYFKEMRSRLGECKFRGCLHVNEPNCAVRAAVEAGEIQPARYQHYVEFLQEIKDRKPRY